MNRRDFLKKSSLTALLAAGEWTGLSKAFTDSPSSTSQMKNEGIAAIDATPQMEYRNLGGMDVSAIGLGCLPMVGYYGGKYDKKEMIALIRRAYEQGVTLFDTAEVYGPYTSEEWVGEALQPFRNKVKIETKFGFSVEEGQNTVLNSSPDHIRRAVEGRKWAERKGVTMAQFALVWMLSRKQWIVPIPGTTNPAHLDDFLGAAKVRLTPYEMEDFDKEYAQIHLMGHRADPFTESQIDK